MSSTPSGWQDPKTNWGSADVVGPQDFNRIEGDLAAIETGSRTLDPTQAPTGNSGTLRQLLDWFANRIGAITGTSNWYDAPPITLQALLNHKSRHATGGADALSPADIGAAPASHTHTPAQISPQGAGSGLDADTVRGAYPGTGANQLVRRDSAGYAQVAARWRATASSGNTTSTSPVTVLSIPFTLASSSTVIILATIQVVSNQVYPAHAAIRIDGSLYLRLTGGADGGQSGIHVSDALTYVDALALASGSHTIDLVAWASSSSSGIAWSGAVLTIVAV